MSVYMQFNIGRRVMSVQGIGMWGIVCVGNVHVVYYSLFIGIDFLFQLLNTHVCLVNHTMHELCSYGINFLAFV